MTESQSIRYVKSKYTLVESARFQVGITIPGTIRSDCGLVILHWNGWLDILKGFPWDGASGPTFDTKSTMCASLAHDALYLLMNQGKLDLKTWRPQSDEQLRRLMIRDKAYEFRADSWLWAVNTFAESFARKQARPIIQAP